MVHVPPEIAEGGAVVPAFERADNYATFLRRLASRFDCKADTITASELLKIKDDICGLLARMEAGLPSGVIRDAAREPAREAKPLPITCGGCWHAQTSNWPYFVICLHENLDRTAYSDTRPSAMPPPADPNLCPLRRVAPHPPGVPETCGQCPHRPHKPDSVSILWRCTETPETGHRRVHASEAPPEWCPFRPKQNPEPERT